MGIRDNEVRRYQLTSTIFHVDIFQMEIELNLLRERIVENVW